MQRVVFVQKFVPHYRLPLFERLRQNLNNAGMELLLIYGPPDPFEGSKVRTVNPEWGMKVNSRISKVFGRYLYWQGVVRHIRKGDIVIVEHASKLLDNYPLFFLQQIRYIKLCYFGHGENFQSKYETKLAKVIKQLTVKRVAKWFAYTEMSVKSLVRQGVPLHKIQTVNNTLEFTSRIKPDALFKRRYQCVYIGGLYVDKRIEFLLEACGKVSQQLPDFELHMVGSGPLSDLVASFASQNSWCTYHGSLYGLDRDKLLYESSAILMPGLVGLVAVDSFHFSTPLITTDCGQHSPEFVYLEHELNSLILENEGTPDSYAALVSNYLQDHELVSRLRQGCKAAASSYTIDDTADRFMNGIVSLTAG